ncbi:MAG: right-handed parallel beta-helix repeat-containing protein, partial [Bryobacterales bacterium]|nr:right-handed parallel beta-helix repeat-containing protein [Bryobacterales bacterium]
MVRVMVLLAVPGLAAGSAELSVSPDGLSLPGAVQKAREEGVKRILVAGGEYFLSEPLRLGPDDSGLTIEASPGARPVIYGGRKLSGWRPDGGRFWAAEVPRTSDFRMLVVNGRFCRPARLPAAGHFTHLSEFTVRWMSTTGGGLQRKPTEEELTTLRYSPGDLGSWLDVHNAELRVYHMWDESLVRLRSLDPATQTVRFANPAGHPPGAFGVRKYVVFNVREGMTEPGQWYLDRTAGKVVYWPLPGEEMRQAEVVAPVAESVVRLEGAKEAPLRRVTLRGLSFSVTNTPAVSGGFGAARYEGAVAVSYCEDCLLSGLSVFNTGGQGIKARDASRLRIERCEVRDSGAGGMIVGGADAEVSGNRIHNVGVTYPSAIALSLSGRGSRVSRNEVFDTPYSAITASGTGHVIEGNRIYRAMRELHDGAAIYITFCKEIVLRGNHVSDIEDSGGYGASAYYLDEQAEKCLVEGNLSVGVARPSHNHMARDNTLRNNVFITEGDARIDLPRSSGYIFEKNVIHAGGKVIFKAPPGAISHMPRNVIFSRAGSVERESQADYKVVGRSALELKDGSVFADPLF